MDNSLLLLIPMLPLLGSLVLCWGIRGTEKEAAISGWIATFVAACSFLVTVSLFSSLSNVPQGTAIVAKLWNWIVVGDLHVSFGFHFDRLAAVMTLVITGVGSLIHLYAIGYMEHDNSRCRFFCYLNLFLFAMLLLVLGDSLLLLFVGWEGVGLCSYLLIGFWYGEMDNAKAGQKAFVVNRIGDAGFLIGMFLLFHLLGTVNIASINSLASTAPTVFLELAAVALFIGAMGKSAQVPLYIWLPDAMAGPTPVSALIHAATMVTAGIYMIARLHPVFAAAEQTLAFISCIGAVTAFLAATIALAQYDIKKVLAYSTVSQLGYMFMALGAGAFSNGIFHVVTHAFFKACLFMGAGSVIVGCHHEQDMRKFGGLRKTMPITFWTYLFATLTIAGIPFLSGFYSKDAILWTVFSSETVVFGRDISQLLWGVGAVTALLTAFYMTRSLILTFFGEYRGEHPAHESPWTMWVPLVILMLLSIFFGGVFGHSLMEYLSEWSAPRMLISHEELAKNHTYHLLEMISMGIAVSGVLLAFVVFLLKPAIGAAALKNKLVNALQALFENKWWVDELYAALIVRPLRGIATVLFAVVDRVLVDGFVGGTGLFVVSNGEIVRRMHLGRIGGYAGVLFCSTIILLLFWLVL